jgi:hypothetical protein
LRDKYRLLVGDVQGVWEDVQFDYETFQLISFSLFDDRVGKEKIMV